MGLDLVLPLVWTAVLVLAVYRAVRSLVPVLRKRREQRYLDRSGVRARGVVHSVHPLRRSPEGHTVTVEVHDGRGRSWHAVDTSGLGGYLVREGTPVELVHSPTDPRSVRVERAALPAPGAGFYPLHPRRRADIGPAVVDVVAPLLFLLFLTALPGMELLAPPEWNTMVTDLIPLVFTLIGTALLVSVAGRALGARLVLRRHTAEAEGTVTDTWREDGDVHVDGRRVSVYPFTVHFRLPDGREVHRRHRLTSTVHRTFVDQRVRVRYDPEGPTRFTVRDFSPGRAGTVVPVIVGVGFILIGTFVTLMFLTSGGS
ncbi:hypothetical protein HNR06_004600 [Nocardiopsis arvandica]|uniref:DUF3592 domain-containing protein n=1 Tax=Nocardiopsis sinuspersici TaxID=501010 RepID=A0A7Y9XFT2_9ACTN|nr:hypothetical protein [Nocardiopsis sinuspersici]